MKLILQFRTLLMKQPQLQREEKIMTSKESITERWFVVALTIWFVSVFTLGYTNVFRLLPLPLVAFSVVASMSLLVVVYYRSGNFRSYVDSISYKHLTLLNIWRIPAGATFLYYGSQNWLPEQFVFNAGYGDLAVGLLVPILLMLPESRAKYLAFHTFGMLDFVLAVGTGLTFTLLQVSLMENIAGYPIVLIPLFGVPVTGAFHIFTLDRLRREQNSVAVKNFQEITDK